jgi:hypothetical protein
MKISNADSDLSIMLSVDELAFICNAINEALDAIDDWEFEIRTGKSRAEAKAISANSDTSLIVRSLRRNRLSF